MAHTGRIIGQAMAGLAGPEITPLVTTPTWLMTGTTSITRLTGTVTSYEITLTVRTTRANVGTVVTIESIRAF